MADKPKFERPTRYPRPNVARDLAAWEAYVAGSLARETATAEKWRTGLAGFITLITTALIIKGPASVDELAPEWRWLVIGLLALGIVMALIATWKAQAAAAPGSDGVEHLEQVVTKWGSVRGYEAAQAKDVARGVAVAKGWIIASISALLAAVIAWWVIPSATPPAQFVVVETQTERVCGTLEKVDDGVVYVATKNGEQLKFDLADVLSLDGADGCFG